MDFIMRLVFWVVGTASILIVVPLSIMIVVGIWTVFFSMMCWGFHGNETTSWLFAHCG